LSHRLVFFILYTVVEYSKTGKVDHNVRVNARKMAELLRTPSPFAMDATPDAKESGESAPVNIVAGSKPPASGAIWVHWESAGFKVQYGSIVV
jgi:hypothetical protein